MDCRRARECILEGKEGLLLRRHLRHCQECAAFRQEIARAEALLRSALPFQAPESLQERLLGLVPSASRRLQAQAGPPPAPRPLPRPLVGLLLLLAVPLALSLGLSLWEQGLAVVLPALNRSWGVIRLLPDALTYWGGQLVERLLPIRDALLFILSILLAGLTLDEARRRPAEARVRR